jgi:hypothetical protein
MVKGGFIFLPDIELTYNTEQNHLAHMLSRTVFLDSLQNFLGNRRKRRPRMHHAPVAMLSLPQ